MVKSRFSSLDVRAMVNSIRPEAVGCKLTNIYDVNSKVYILKLARRGFKRFLLLESGMRFHITDYMRDKSTTPSHYTMKLRKHIRTRRLTDIQQIGSDRSVDFTFGRGENSFHLILELYVSGNLILTDHEYRILALLRTQNSDQQSKVAVKEIYPLEKATGLLVVPLSEFPDAVDKILEKSEKRQMNQEDKEADQEDEKANQAKKRGESIYIRRSKKRVDHAAMPLVSVLHKLAPWTDPQLCASCIHRVVEADGDSCKNAFKLNVEDFDVDEVVSILQRAAELALDTLRSVSRPDDLGGGHMAALAEPVDGDAEEVDEDEDEDDEEKPANSNTPEAANSGKPEAKESRAPPEAEAPIVPGWIVRKRIHVPPAEPHWVNDEFTPMAPDAAGNPEAVSAFATFHLCVDEFFMRLEEHKVEEVKAQHAQSVFAKVDRIKDDQGRRIAQLEAEQEASERQAELIQANVELVERVLAMLNAMVASQVDWGELWREVKHQQRQGHPMAQHIQSLDLERNEVRLILGAKADDDDFDLEEDSPMEVVALDLSLSAHANVARLHSRRKETREKTSRTAAHAETAVKQAERKAHQDLKKFELKQTLRRVRQNWWFEKFLWFVSSENYLVLAGRDASQAEQIFCKHMGPQDIFVQADVAGARSCFVKNIAGGEVPPATLREAGTMALCHSSAWDKRMVISAWWVTAEQVSRAPAGSTAPLADNSVMVEGFIVSGQRNFMPPVHLEMGMTVLFHVGESSAARHRGERRSRYLENLASGAGGSKEEEEEEAAATQEVPEEVAEEEVAAESDDSETELQDAAADSAPAEPCTSPASPAEAERLPAEVEEPSVEAQKEAEVEDDNAAADEAADVLDDALENGGLQSGAADALEERSAAEIEAEAEADVNPQDGDATQCDGDADAANADESSPSSRGPRGEARLSKAERRRQKKGVGGGGGDAVECAADVQLPERKTAKEKKAAKEPKTAPGPAPLPRGQRAKAKKIKEKYADQDEEERELRMMLLGSKASKAHPGTGASAATEPQAAPAPRAAAATPDGVTAAAKSAGGKAGAGRSPAAAAATAASGAADRSSGKGKGEGRHQPRRQQSATEVQRPGCDFDAAADEQLAQLDILTGQPAADDEVLYAVPMVAPYCALGGPYSLRVKLTPGQTKKGQAARTCLKMLEQQYERPAWKVLVQAIPENDTASLFCGTCKLSMPGMQKLQQQARKEKRKEKKDA